MVNVLEKELNSYFAQLNDAEKKSVLLMLKTFLLRKDTNKNTADSLEEYNKQIDEALTEIEKGDYISQDEMENRASKW